MLYLISKCINDLRLFKDQNNCNDSNEYNQTRHKYVNFVAISGFSIYCVEFTNKNIK